MFKKKRSRRDIKGLTSSEELTEVLPEKEEKNIKREEDKGESVIMCMSHGLMTVIGRRRVMEDAVKVSFGEIKGYDFFAVFDGYGWAEVANACRDMMHRLLVKEVQLERTRGGNKKLEWEKVMTCSLFRKDGRGGTERWGPQRGRGSENGGVHGGGGVGREGGGGGGGQPWRLKSCSMSRRHRCGFVQY